MKSIINLLTGLRDNTPVEPYVPGGERLYVIGDIHGRVDLLQQIHNKIQQDAANYPGSKQLIYLGDYIDRGDHSKEVIDLLLEHPLPEFEATYLRGNHEQSMLDFLQAAEVGRSWFNYGGLATLVSYNVKYNKLPTRKKDFEEIQNSLKERVPHIHINFLEKTEFSHTAGNYYCVHAGIRPKVALRYQLPEDQLWIREDFVSYNKPHEKIIVHGHTLIDEPDLQTNRIGLDTGAYISGKLTCLVLENTTQRILQTNA
jgi:serine/threonine protein phosphatase 1